MNQAMIMELQEKYSISNQLEEQFNLISQQVNELEDFGVHLSELDSSNENEILASLGKGVYIPSTIKEKELYVNVGSGIFVKKKPGEAKKVVEGQLKELAKAREELAERIEGLNEEMRELMQKLETEKAK
ncbi:prefoldin subunit alpha [Candidatus Pacearchaeota archaeon CG10_big_fil_rev_8_21_14_0_10_35_219]|nr:prefoldin subunit alpha [Candidatus Pacearchaeota archaeon]OIO42298.1 MAG: prefoldin subunit alpha [Candidatus Pacearchaeota archaeon CG1_02_35_32]PIO07468.1 MAG: prefoldin subunit alpha [Candidatus Pacearchaeota archaeon CG10_big_fil_rev_8_21_14_0_10_35_219]PIY81274.1 MAG: prefoldin subunit alpha [Candidatus Pacearchaeota archaeon CG_4_10_14_0_8_um_filter_35_169]PIZ80203.1 MAG: prefoldin subunit alpha [Candidatus Pacearchaeota archaeon CG_4_10_14_0_2_um_filter_35_33]PJA69532.1 MAG: prefold